MEVCYDIVTEGANFDSFKERLNRVFETAKRALKNALNAIRSIINKFLNKKFGTSVIEINRSYYNNMMNIINKIKSLDITPIAKLKIYISGATFNYDKLNQIYTDLANKLEDLKDLETNSKKIIPSNIGPTVVIKESHFTNMRNMFNAMQTQYAAEIQGNTAIHDYVMSLFNSGKIKDSNFGDHSLTEVVDMISTIVIRTSRINLMKATLLISLVDTLTRNRIKNDEYSSDYTNGKYKNIKPSKSNNTPKHTVPAVPIAAVKYSTAKESLESFINYCDNMIIVEESISKAKKIYKSGRKELDKNYEYVMDLPDSTEE